MTPTKGHAIGADLGGRIRRGAATCLQRLRWPQERQRSDGRPDAVWHRDCNFSVSHTCYAVVVAREITQRELRNESGDVMRALDAGESFVVTRNGVGVGELTPLRHRRFVDRAAALEAFANAAQIDSKRFRQDLDRHASQDATPRA
jgi:prevent-host-death family protein